MLPHSISLLIPAYNAARWLPDLLADARQQTHPFAEVLVYDDASSDETSAIAREWGVRVFRGETNRGAGFARNRLIESASSDYIHFHDADDRLDRLFNERMEPLLKGPEECAVCGARTVEAATNREVSRHEWTALNSESDPLRYFLRTQCAMVVGVYPLSLVRKAGCFREDVRGGEDYDFHIRIAAAGGKFHALPDYLCTIRRFGNLTFTERQTHQYLLDNLRVVTEHANRFRGKYDEELGFVAIDLAWRLFERGDRTASRKAQELARDLGRRELSSNSTLFRLFSRWFGFGFVFHLRKFRDEIHRVATRS